VATREGSAEKRHHPRYPLVLRVDYGDRDEFHSEWTENVSAGGMFVRTDREFATGEPVAVELSFPGLLQPLEVRGRVAWIRSGTPMQPSGVGVEATHEASRRRLAALATRARDQAVGTVAPAFRVVLVEDNPRVTRSYERVLRRLGTLSGESVQVVFAPNGHAALSIIDEQRADLLVTDVYMPVMDGFTLIERLRASPKTATLPVIVITGGRAGERHRARDLGVTAFLHKPVQFGQLLETIVCLINLIEAKAEGDLGLH
jgi:uncharacterized protein (TIGR02266 family)